MLCYFYFLLIAAIFDSQRIHTLGSLRSSLVMLPDLENMGIAVGILFLPQATILILYFRFIPFGCQVPTEKLDPENIGIAVGISLPSCIQPELRI